MENGLFETLELVVADGPHKGRYPLSVGSNAIGRDPDAKIIIDDSAVSRAHACITVADDITLEDLGSAQGTWLNGRMLVGKDFLFDNDEVRIGPCTFRIQVRRREGRSGVLFGGICLIVAAALCALALVAPHAAVPVVSTGEVQETPGTESRRDWHDWETLQLPAKAELERNRIALTPQSAQEEFRLATSLYDDRLVDLGNAYRGLLHYKQALALAAMLPLASRPAIANRSLDALMALRELIRTSCEKRVFAYQRACEMQWWQECYRVLREIQVISPDRECRYHRWAEAEIQRLDQMLQP